MKYTFRHKEYMSDTEIQNLYHMVVEQELGPYLFYDGGVDSAELWLEYVKAGQWLVEVSSTDGVCGVFWLNGFIGRTAQMHFCTWRTLKDKQGVAEAALKWLKELEFLDSLYGCTPKVNKAAVGYMIASGFKPIGELPGACYMKDLDKHVPGVVSVLDFKQIAGG